MKKIIITIILLTILSPLFGEEYWDTYFHTSGLTDFDTAAMVFTQLSKDEAENKDVYTVVEYDKEGNVTEAISYLNGKPNYYFSYMYRDNNPIYREMSYFVGDKGESKILSQVYFTYSPSCELLSSAYYYMGKLKYGKKYTGKMYQPFNYSVEAPETNDLGKQLINEIKELQRLESRSLLKKIFGLR